MKTKIVTIGPQADNEAVRAALAEAGAVLRRGGLVVFPTETVYGLGGDAFNETAAARIYEAKGRPSDNPLIVHIADVTDLDRLLRDTTDETAKTARVLADAFWPGPLTMVLKKTDDLPLQTTGGLSTVGVRLPANEIARELIRQGGGFVAAPSANVSGKPSPTSAAHCIADLDGRVDFIIDGGDCEIGLESTIVDLTGQVPEILRPGRITKDALFAALDLKQEDSGPEEKQVVPDTDEAPRAPGMKYRHYAPKGTLTVVRGRPEHVRNSICAMLEQARAEGKKTGVIATDETAAYYPADTVLSTGSRTDADALSHNLYRVLRGMDEAGAEELFFEMASDRHCTDAVQNRLYKACGGRITDV